MTALAGSAAAAIAGAVRQALEQLRARNARPRGMSVQG